MKSILNRNILLSVALATLLAAPLSEAAKLGKSKSSGMQRSAPTQSYQPSAMPNAPVGGVATKPKSNIGSALAAGAVGAAAGYMLASAFDDSDGGLPWGTILLAALAGWIGLRILKARRSSSAKPSMYANNQNNMNSLQSMSAMPATGPQGMHQFSPLSTGGVTPAPATLTRLTDGTEPSQFLRQAKATFLHLQSLNNKDNIQEIEKYMTPALFNELRNDIQENADIADFTQLDCQIIEAVQEGNQHIASVRFSGLVSESLNSAPTPFTEVWHYVKNETSQNRWLVAGIQQV